MSKVSPMSDEFHDWLDQCPVMWFRGEVTRDHVAYSFETPDEEDDDKEDDIEEKITCPMCRGALTGIMHE